MNKNARASHHSDYPVSKLVSDVIKERKTLKVLTDIYKPLAAQNLDPSILNELLEAAHWAPFHKPASQLHNAELSSIVPWRAYVLDSESCRNLLETLKLWAKSDASWLKGKMPSLLATASALIQVTWLPNPSKSETPALFEATKQNMEHIAAASAAIQNILLAATAKSISNYWASGGPLLRDEVFELLNIPKSEIILGSLFLFPEQTSQTEVFEGAWRHKRGELGDWSRHITLSKPHITLK